MYLIKDKQHTSLWSLHCATATSSCMTHLLQINPCARCAPVHYSIFELLKAVIQYSLHELLKVATVDPVLVANAHRWKIQLGKESERKDKNILPLTCSGSWLMLWLS